MTTWTFRSRLMQRRFAFLFCWLRKMMATRTRGTVCGTLFIDFFFLWAAIRCWEHLAWMEYWGFSVVKTWCDECYTLRLSTTVLFIFLAFPSSQAPSRFAAASSPPSLSLSPSRGRIHLRNTPVNIPPIVTCSTWKMMAGICSFDKWAELISTYMTELTGTTILNALLGQQ